MKSARLIIRLDDAGASPEANAGVLAACERATTVNVSVMAAGPALGPLVDRLRGLACDSVCVGLHATLNCERSSGRWGSVLPSGRVRSLVEPDGTFTRAPAVLYQRGFDLNEVILELRAQLTLLREAGLRVRYIDAHMGVGWLPGVRLAIERLADEEGLIAAERFAYLPIATAAQDTRPGRLFAAVDRWRQSGRRGEPMTWVLHPEDSVPGSIADATADPDESQEHRDRQCDLAMVVDPTTHSWLAERGVAPVTYGEAGGQRGPTAGPI